MAGPYKMERSAFTGNSIGGSPGESSGLKRTKIMGGEATLLSAYPQDNIHGVSLPNCTGDTMGGSDSNLSHSLNGASAELSVAPRNGKSGKKEI